MVKVNSRNEVIVKTPSTCFKVKFKIEKVSKSKDIQMSL